MAEFGQVIICGKHRYVSPAASSLVRETGLNDPVAAIERLADDLLQEGEVSEFPVPLEMLASFRWIKRIDRIDMKGSGQLIPVSRYEYKVEVRATDPAGRQNFTIGHEIGHTLIPSYSENPTKKTDLLTGEFARDKEEEFFCDIAARNILLPERLFRAQCAKITPSIEGLLELASLCQASIEAVAIRLDQLRCWSCIPVVWELDLKPTQKKVADLPTLPGLDGFDGPAEQYRVKFPAGDYLFPTARHIDMDSSMIAGCLESGEFKGRCVVPTGGKDMDCKVEAVAVPYRNEHEVLKQRVVSLVFT